MLTGFSCFWSLFWYMYDFSYFAVYPDTSMSFSIILLHYVVTCTSNHANMYLPWQWSGYCKPTW